MSLASRYLEAVRWHEESADDPALFPTVLVRACAEVLPAAGAGLSLVSDLRIPLAASDERVTIVERLQTSLGEGPCLTAVTRAEPLVADLDAIAVEWPVFHERMVDQTEFRSVASVPVRLPGAVGRVALDLYSTETSALPERVVQEIAADVAGPIGVLLSGAPPVELEHGVLHAGWLGNQLVEQRMQVWVAVGMVLEQATLSSADALATLRAYAYGQDLTLDQTAHLLVTRQLPLHSIID